MNETGLLSDGLLEILRGFELFRDYEAGRVAQEEYVARLEEQADDFMTALPNRRMLDLLAARYPANCDRHAEELFEQLRAEGLVDGDPQLDAFDDYRTRVLGSFDHGDNRSAIQPDEAKLLYMIASAIEPKRMVTAGAFYGFWAIWGMPGVAAADGSAILIDPNQSVSELSAKNFAALGFGDRTTARAELGEDVFPGIDNASLDLVCLDASGGPQAGKADYSGKGVYAYLLEAFIDKMKPGSLLVTHNDYQLGVGDNALSHRFVVNSSEKLERFHALCDQYFRKSFVADTPDGFGVYLK